jgi:hypothetical protein
MKKLFIAILFLAVVFGACGQTLLYRDSVTLNWDASPSEVLTGERIEYNVYIWNMAAGDPELEPVSSLTFVQRVNALTITIDMLAYAYAEYALAVESVRVRADSTEVVGGVAYTTVAAHVDPTLHPLGRFTYASIQGVPPARAENLADSEM